MPPTLDIPRSQHWHFRLHPRDMIRRRNNSTSRKHTHKTQSGKVGIETHQGQKWSIFFTQRWTSLQWWARSGLKFIQVLHHAGIPSYWHTNTSLVHQSSKPASICCSESSDLTYFGSGFRVLIESGVPVHGAGSCRIRDAELLDLLRRLCPSRSFSISFFCSKFPLGTNPGSVTMIWISCR